MTNLSFAQLRQKALSKGIKAATKLRKAELVQLLEIKNLGQAKSQKLELRNLPSTGAVKGFKEQVTAGGQ